MEKLRMDNVLVGHCHIQFNARVFNPDNNGHIDQNRYIQFSAVDKCLKTRKFLKFVEFDQHNHLQDVDKEPGSKQMVVGHNRQEDNTEDFLNNNMKMSEDIQSMLNAKKQDLGPV